MSLSTTLLIERTTYSMYLDMETTNLSLKISENERASRTNQNSDFSMQAET